MRRFTQSTSFVLAALLATAPTVTLLCAQVAHGVETVEVERANRAATIHQAPWTSPLDSANPPESKYAPDRKVDVQHFALDVTPDFKKQTVAGAATFTFKPIGKPLDEIRLDAIDLSVAEITSTSPIASHNVTNKEIVVSFAKPIPVGAETSLTISYSTKPALGFYFRGPAGGYSQEDEHAFSQGEMIEARDWFPCWDHPNSKFTSEITCHVPEGMAVLSNGQQISQKKDADGKVAVRWLQDKPHVNYLISLVAGNFSKIEDSYRGIPLRFYTLPSDKNEAQSAFAPTKLAMEFFENEIGIPYPWAQYGQVVVHSYHHGGMENTTLTTLGEPLLYPRDSENVFAYGGIYNVDGCNYQSEVILSHELAHQWFGDLVTCKDWSHVWLNEGFATYYSLLFAGHKNGHDDMLYGLYQDQKMILEMKEERPIVYRRFKEPVEQFSYTRAYAKASWVVHMLRAELGEELFRRCIKTYIERFQFKTVVTEDLNSVVEELSGKSFDRFFDQWVYGATVPDLTVSYDWDEKEKLAKVSVNQVQKVGEQRSKMQFPLTLRFKTKKGIVERKVDVMELEEDFYVPLEQAPDIVRIDPEFTLLAKIDFKSPAAMLYQQLADKDDVIGRILATEQLAEKSDETTIAKLKDCLNNDKFFGVRVKASEALRKIHTEEALEALIASTKQPDARARIAVIRDIGKFFNPRALDTLLKCLDSEKNSAIVAYAISGLSAYHKPEVHDKLLAYLHGTSYQSRLAEAAIKAMKEQSDISYIEPLRKTLVERESELYPKTFTAGLDALAYLAKDEKNRDDVRNFIAGYLNHKRILTQNGAIQALGVLGDPKAIPLLETFASSSTRSPQHWDAERALSYLRNWNKPNDNLKDLRDQVLDLQKSQRTLKKELDDLQKRLKATETKKTKTTSGKTPASSKKSVKSEKSAQNTSDKTKTKTR